MIADTLYLQDGAHYMIYTPVDPLLFVAVKVSRLLSNFLLQHSFLYMMSENGATCFVQDKDGVLHIAEDVSSVMIGISLYHCNLYVEQTTDDALWMFSQDLMDDPAVVDAIDEETEFTALVVRWLFLTLWM